MSKTEKELFKLKTSILNSCKEIQQDSIDKLSLEVKDAQQSANEYGSPRDRYDAYRAQLLRKRDMYAQQLHKAKIQFEALNLIDIDKKYEKVEYGAVVRTNKNKIFVSISLGKISVSDDKSNSKADYYAVSPNVPIYKAMVGKGVGETFVFNGNEFTIFDIY